MKEPEMTTATRCLMALVLLMLLATGAAMAQDEARAVASASEGAASEVSDQEPAALEPEPAASAAPFSRPCSTRATSPGTARRP